MTKKKAEPKGSAIDSNRLPHPALGTLVVTWDFHDGSTQGNSLPLDDVFRDLNEQMYQVGKIESEAEAKAYFSAKQSAKAKGHGKLTGTQSRRICRLYEQRCIDGEKYGAIKALAAQFGVSRTTISTIVNAKKK